MTLKEFMHTPNPELDKLAIEAETARQNDEDIIFERKIKMNRTFKVETMTTPATDKQISTIININSNYIIKGIKYPETTFFSKAHAIMLLEELFKAKDSAERRPFDRDMYYTLYERFAARYPDNHMHVPVRDYRTDTENIPEDDTPAQHKGLPTPETVRHAVADKAFCNSVLHDFLDVT